MPQQAAGWSSASPPNFAGHWTLDLALTQDRRAQAGLDRASGDSATPLGKHLIITQDTRALTVSDRWGSRLITMVFRFDGTETRDLTVGRDAPIEERSTAHWEGTALIVRTTRRLTTTHETFPTFVRKWSLDHDILVVTTNGKIDACFRRDLAA